MSMRCVYRWVVAGVMATGTILIAETEAAETWQVQLDEGEHMGLAATSEQLALGDGAGPSAIYHFPSEGRFQSHPKRLEQAAGGVVVRMRAQLPAGTAALIHVRGKTLGKWQPWEEAIPGKRLRFDRPAEMLQLRAVLLGDSGHSPLIHGIAVEMIDDMVLHATARRAPTYRIFATRQGLVGHRTANGHRIRPRDRFVALPSWRVLNDAGERDYQVRISYGGRSTVVPVWDVGPWNTRDNYWSAQREMWQDLPRGMPQAQAAYQFRYNGGRDQFGRRPRQPNGIDIADGAFWDALGLRQNAWVNVTFLWMGDEDGPQESTPTSVPDPPVKAVKQPEEADRTPPTAKIDAARHMRKTSYFVRWSGRDDRSGIASYDVQVRRGTEGRWGNWLSGTRANEGLFKLAVKQDQLEFRVRARDKAGNVSDYSAPTRVAPSSAP